MKIEHLAIWCEDLDAVRTFYEHFFGAESGARYHNPDKAFESYFLSFDDGARLELMRVPSLRTAQAESGRPMTGLAHFALSVGSEAAVDALTTRIAEAGFRVPGQPRRTGDGYYESVVLDPEGNQVEITP